MGRCATAVRRLDREKRQRTGALQDASRVSTGPPSLAPWRDKPVNGANIRQQLRDAPPRAGLPIVQAANCSLAKMGGFGIFRAMSNLAAAAPTPSKASVFFRRLITTVILWTVILTSLFSGHRFISNAVFLLGLVIVLNVKRRAAEVACRRHTSLSYCISNACSL